MRQGSTAPPRWLAVFAGGSLALVLAVAGYSSFRILTHGQATAVPVVSTPKAAARVQEQRHPERAPAPSVFVTPDWVGKLFDSKCDVACLGGNACAATGNKPCPSRYACIPGERDDMIEMDMPLGLRLSTVVGREGKPDPCVSSMKEAIVCLTPTSTRMETCVPLADTCSAAGRASILVPIVARDLVTGGVAIQIRSAKNRGSVFAMGGLQYGTPLRRVGLCTGFKAGGLIGTRSGEIKYVTFFVEPRSGE